MKSFFGVVLALGVSVAAAAGGDTFQILLPTPYTFCSGSGVAENPKQDDVLASFPASTTRALPRMNITRGSGGALVTNIEQAVKINPELVKDPNWNPAWLTEKFWQTLPTCGL